MQDGWPCSFQSTLPAGGERHGSDAKRYKAIGFQSTLPVGGATNATKQHLLTEQFQSTLPVGGATPSSLLCFVLYHISIHAPREGSDLPILVNRRFLIKFQSTLPVGGSDLTFAPSGVSPADFNPRSPWGERPIDRMITGHQMRFQSTLPAGGSDPRWGLLLSAVHISIHAPRGGSDAGLSALISKRDPFQSTLPAGGATSAS